MTFHFHPAFIEAGMDIESKEPAWKAELELSEVPRELSNAEIRVVPFPWKLPIRAFPLP